MRVIGVRELMAKASEIVRNVHGWAALYIITCRGRPVGLPVPLDHKLARVTSGTSTVWDELTRPDQKFGRDWPAGVTDANVFETMRR